MQLLIGHLCGEAFLPVYNKHLTHQQFRTSIYGEKLIMSQEETYYYRIVSESWLPRVLDFLYGHYYPDEPMNQYMNLYDGKNRNESANEDVAKCLPQNLTVAAVDRKTDAIVGRDYFRTVFRCLPKITSD